MSKHLFILIFSALCVFNANAQIPNWEWAKSAGGFDADLGRDVCTDGSDNIIIVGQYQSPSITFGTTTLTNTSAASPDIYIVKYDSSGNVLWALSEGGTTYDDVFGVCTDTNDNIIITGTFESPAISFGSFTLTNSGSADIFIVKYDPSGNVVWAKSAGGAFDDYSNGISSDGSGNLFITGYFGSTSITFDSTNLNNVDPGSGDLFVVKYESSGSVLWAKSAGGLSDDGGESISADANGNSLITGMFYSTSIAIGSTTLVNAGGGDLFVTKLDSSGNFLWAKSAGGIADDFVSDISADGSGNMVVTGFYLSPSITFGSTTLINANAFGPDIIIVKYDASGVVLWAKSSGGIDADLGLAIAIEGGGNILVSGAFQSASIDFGSITLNNVNTGTEDIFVVKYDPFGNMLWTLSKGGNTYDRAQDISLSGSGNIIITGSFDSPFLNFGLTTLTNQGFADIFVAKLDSNLFTGIGELNISNDLISIYPNPCNGQFALKSSENIEEIEITNISGQLVYEAKPNENNISLRLSDSGIYFMKITFHNQSLTRKLIAFVQ